MRRKAVAVVKGMPPVLANDALLPWIVEFQHNVNDVLRWNKVAKDEFVQR